MKKIKKSKRETVSWAKAAASLGAGEIVLNCMNNDVYASEDIEQLKAVRQLLVCQ